MNSFGNRFKVEIFGASHAPEVGVDIWGIPDSINPCDLDFNTQLARRKGGSAWTTPRVEEDTPLFEDLRADGGPFRIRFENRNVRSEDYSGFEDIPRPGHADFTSLVKYGRTFPGGGIFSGRMTLPLVAAGAVAQAIISPAVIRASLVEVGGISCSDREAVRQALGKAAEEGDSLGAVVRCVCEGIPAGLGEPFFDSLESVISHAVFSIPGIRGIEFGDGFAAAAMRGSQHNDPFIDASGHTSKNGCGGINGGISNGNPIIFNVAVKPTSTIRKTQHTFNFAEGKMADLSAGGRHDVCFALRVPPVIEAVTAIVLADFITA
ncbi:MAG: chorismate synthase [Bacteroidales bacterium]|nr:chorismate synthase [Candidatus Cacconaster scatequi]